MIKSKTHSFDVEHAKLYGLREAVLIYNLHFWVSYNHANGKHRHDDRTWTYNSVHAFEALFPYLTYKQIRTSLDTLITLDVLVRGYYSTNPSDRSSWYAFTDAFLADNPLPEAPAPAKKKGAPLAQQGTPSAPQGKSTPMRPPEANTLPEPVFTPSAPQGTPLALEGTSLITADINTDVNLIPAAPTALPAVVEVIKPAKAPKAKAEPDAETEAAKATRQAAWAAFDDAYQRRYGTTLPRNATTNSQMASLVRRLGQEASGVAAFYVGVNDAFLIRTQHSLGALLQNAEGYRTQWATGRSMTATRAQQLDKTGANFSAADEAKAISRARRAANNGDTHA